MKTPVRRIAVTGSLLTALAGGSVLAATAASASTDTATVTTATTPGTTASPQVLAPDCVHFTQYKHTSHTNVYLDNNCSTNVRIRVIMTAGTDSPCISLPKGTQNYEFVSGSHTGFQSPHVTRIDSC